ncbi:hypothetical protein [Oricola cellulosilytica]|uniref:Uncharacterized protein n=1 Tax=Oricola cellulosilytica TaxID=1429082 RepID=A0A4R0PB22_9HYPH|nr:hypothetical protein [Oricola cellulosilytica]TCD14442.1 hypothetical protein E0D97_10290 [Oricola cellulosilytica]
MTMAADATHSIEQDSLGEPSLCMRTSVISAVGVTLVFTLVALLTHEWAWLVIPAAVVFMAGIQGLLLVFFPALRGRTACGMKGCGDAR